ncbi:MAG: hypothetical protein DRO88_03300 [Promethearchaeia archaeon]|nr:MAG: hypothetical protein DRO88_03300 [Candidatus Lokiarchaeia archaeon]
MLKNLKLKDYATLLGTMCGAISIYLTISPFRAYRGAMFMIFLGVIADLFDGFIARKTREINEFGVQLDSLSDAIVFGVAPAILLFMNYTEPDAVVINPTYPNWVILISAILLICAGIIRLAWFNVSHDNPVYQGMPIPMTATALCLLVFSDYFAWAINQKITLYNRIIYWSMPIIIVFFAWTNVTNKIRFGEIFRKKTGYIKWIYRFLAISLCILTILVFVDRFRFAVIIFIASWIFLGMYIYFLVVGFRTAKRKTNSISQISN